MNNMKNYFKTPDEYNFTGHINKYGYNLDIQYKIIQAQREQYVGASLIRYIQFPVEHKLSIITREGQAIREIILDGHGGNFIQFDNSIKDISFFIENEEIKEILDLLPQHIYIHNYVNPLPRIETNIIFENNYKQNIELVLTSVIYSSNDET